MNKEERLQYLFEELKKDFDGKTSQERVAEIDRLLTRMQDIKFTVNEMQRLLYFAVHYVAEKSGGYNDKGDKGMIKSVLLKDKDGYYLTLTNCKEMAFRFENADVIAALVKVLQLNTEEIEETEKEVANAEIKNDW